MDILAANDQENVVRNLQAGPAGKALNAGLKGFASKTPGNKAPKTPFKVPLNDENAVQKAGKSVLQTKGNGNENFLRTVKKDGKPDANAFMTPAGPRSRAPLGMKTTNAKAQAFQTPAPLTGSIKTQKASPRLRRPKVKVHQPQPESEEDDVPDIEYMPPKEVPLPDDMEDYLPRDWKPVLDNSNTLRGIFNVYHNPIEDDGRTRIEREWDESLERDKKMRELEEEKFVKMWEKEVDEAARYFTGEPSKKSGPKPTIKPAETKRKATGPTTLNARSAASALSGTTKPSFAAPTTAAKARLPQGPPVSRKPTRPAMAPSATRHATATAASKSTIGYAQGRANNTSTTPRKPLSNVTKPALFSATSRQPTGSAALHNRNASTSSMGPKPRGAFSRSSSTSTNATLVAPLQEEEPFRTAEEVERELEAMFLQGSDDEDVDTWANAFASQLGGGDPFDEELEDFQLQLPAGL